MTTSRHHRKGPWQGTQALMWKAWWESRGRFFASLVLLTALVVYAVFTAPGFLSRYNARFPDKPLMYSAYVWSGLFHYALQGLWILTALMISLGGLARERATGVALFTLGLPVRRMQLFLVRAGMAAAESVALGVISALLIPVLSRLVGESYSYKQAIFFGVLMSVAGLTLVAFGLLLSEIFDGEFTAPVVGLCSVTAVFLSYKAHRLHGWNVFDVMSATGTIDPVTQMLKGIPWAGLMGCLALTMVLLAATGVLVRRRDA